MWEIIAKACAGLKPKVFEEYEEKVFFLFCELAMFFSWIDGIGALEADLFFFDKRVLKVLWEIHIFMPSERVKWTGKFFFPPPQNESLFGVMRVSFSQKFDSYVRFIRLDIGKSHWVISLA